MTIAPLFLTLVLGGLLLGGITIGIFMTCTPRLRCFSPWLVLVPIIGVVGGLIGAWIGGPVFAAVSVDARAYGVLIGCISGTYLGSLAGFWFALPGKYE